MTAAEHERGRRRLLAALGPRKPAWWRSPRLMAVAAACACAALAASVLFMRRGAQAQMEGLVVERSASGAMELTSGEHQGRLSLEDGAVVLLAPGSHVTVARHRAEGEGQPRLTLRSGTVSVRRPPGALLSFSVAVGALRVEVDADSDVRITAGPAGATTKVLVESGTSTVRASARALRLGRGEATSATESRGVLRFDDERATPARSAEPEPVATANEPPARSSANPPPRRSWSSRARAGEYADILAEAETSGTDQVLATAPLSELVALADAARYQRHSDLAARVLLTQRKRFAASSEARSAAFFLGRTAEETGTSDTALRWYDTYLREAPRGPFLLEACGRRLALLSKQAPQEAAREAARDYLVRFPGGPYRNLARDVLGRQP